MNKLLIGALAGLADLTQLVSSVKTKSQVESGHSYKNIGGGNAVNFLGKPIYQNQKLNENFSPNPKQTTLAYDLPATSSITANPASNPNLPFYGNPYFCKDRHEAQLALFDQRIKDLEGRAEANSRNIASLNSDMDATEP